MSESYAEIRNHLTPIIQRIRQLQGLNPADLEYALMEIAHHLETADGMLESLQEAP